MGWDLFLVGAPELKDMEREVAMMERVGKWLNLTCEARCFPRPVITWNVTGSPVRTAPAHDTHKTSIHRYINRLIIFVCVCACVLPEFT